MKAAERSAQRELSLQKKYHDQVQRLQRIQSSKLPDIHDQYSWGTDLIYTRARELGIDVKSTHETYRSTSEDSLYKLYALTINISATYQHIVEFVEFFERNNSLLYVISVEIHANVQNPNKHACTILFEWPSQPDIFIDETA